MGWGGGNSGVLRSLNVMSFRLLDALIFSEIEKVGSPWAVDAGYF